MSLDLLNSVATDITLYSAKKKGDACLDSTASDLEVTVREKVGKVLEKVSDKLNSVKQAGQQVAQRVPSLGTTAPERVSQSIDNLISTNQAAIDEQIERGAWAKITGAFWGIVGKKAASTAVVTRATSALSSLPNPGQLYTSARDTGTSLYERWTANLPTISMPSPSIPKFTLPSVTLPKLPMPSLSMPTLPAIRLPSFQAPSLPNIVTNEYVQKGVEKGIEIVIDEGLGLVQEAITRPLHETVDQIEGQIESGLRRYAGKETTECMEAATTIVHYRTAKCAAYINGSVQSLKGKIGTGLRVASRWLYNSCCSTTLPASV